MKKIFFIASLLVILTTVLWVAPVAAQRSPVDIYFFYGQGCPHCIAEEYFLGKLVAERPELVIHKYEIWYSKDNQKLLQKAAEALKINISGVPLTIISDKVISGFLNEDTTGREITQALDNCRFEVCPDRVAPLLNEKLKDNNPPPDVKPNDNSKQSLPEKVKVPLIGEVKLRELSLPLLSLVIGTLDGFNPCAMWVLVFLIMLLVGMNNRRRMFILGGVFLLSEALIYLLFMTAWLQIFIFLGMIFWVRLLIGLVAVVTGILNLKEYWTNPTAACKVTSGEEKKKISERIRAITQQKSFWLALGGVMALAFAVNLIEIVCSLGLPAIYMQVLALSDLSWWQYFIYLFIYLFFFMLDDMVIFTAALITSKSFSGNSKYSHYAQLVSGLLLLALGALLVFRPEWLMFG